MMSIQAEDPDPAVTIIPTRGITRGHVSIEAITNIIVRGNGQMSPYVIRVIISPDDQVLHQRRKYVGTIVDEMEIHDIATGTRTTLLHPREDGMMHQLWGHLSVKHIRAIWCRMMKNIWTNNLP